MEFRKLKPEEIDVKVGSVTAKGYTLLLYKNARVDMTILDETVGAENWQNKFYEVCGNLYCSVGINFPVGDKDRWVWKDDCGVESAFGDKEKGQASDARKRAGFAWGIGRELYTSPLIFIYCETQYDEKSKSYKIVDDKEKYRRFNVVAINYDGDRIETLKIVDNKGVVAFDNTKQPKPKGFDKFESTDDVEVGEFTFGGGKHKGKTIAWVYENDKSYLDWCMENDKVNDELKDRISDFYMTKSLEE